MFGDSTPRALPTKYTATLITGAAPANCRKQQDFSATPGGSEPRNCRVVKFFTSDFSENLMTTDHDFVVIESCLQQQAQRGFSFNAPVVFSKAVGRHISPPTPSHAILLGGSQFSFLDLTFSRFCSLDDC
jgi:hypothetical protein